ncbi:probable disease resistance protein At5g63020 [Beta vulgaris subsp. vulgaris]|uniref:probable disease resistance protein At5g63020 n=1 Tax=Beta vulgaris subsp. vulgaris TaxID=3555 RepID=UPI0005401F57|nr:probable disease resistance protein At5g63020 [Beta vulgaris subsp. vulgaris]
MLFSFLSIRPFSLQQFQFHHSGSLSMDALVMVVGILSLLTLFTGVLSLDDRKRTLKSKLEYLRARTDDIENIERSSLFNRVQRSKKRKKENDICVWVVEARELMTVAENLLTQVEECRNFLTSAKKRKIIDKLVHALEVHDKKGDMIYIHAFSDEQGLHRGNCIPVKKVTGQEALNSLEELQNLLKDAKVGRVAILGKEGIGKTFLMKHLHNYALKVVEKFDHVFWVTSPEEFSIKNVQDAIAAVVRCDLASDDDLNVRASKLSNTLAGLSRFLLFLDGVPKVDYCLNQIGIPVPVEGSECKLVITTPSSAFECRMLNGFKTVELDHLLEEEAFELFMHEAKIDMRCPTLFNNIPRLLVKKCRGVPRTIVNLASCLRGITDLHEWNNTLYEFGKLEKRIKLPSHVITDEIAV